MFRPYGSLLGSLIALLVLQALLAGSAGAIPAFSRKYRTSCNTCHVAYPKLNDFGQGFRRNGFQWPVDDDFFVKDKPVTMAAQAWKDLWPKALWPSDLPGLPPVSFRTVIGMDQAESAAIKGDVDAPTDVNILAAGTIGEDIGFFFHQGGNSRYYVQFSNLLEEQLSETLLPRYALNLKAGLFEPELFGFSNARRLSATPWLSHTATYLRDDGRAGNGFAVERQIGAEAHGVIANRVRYVLGGVSGNGDTSDNNNAKDVYGRISLKLGGMPFTGEADEDEGSTEEDEEKADALFRDNAHVDNSITLGAFFWNGRYTAFDSDPGFNRAYDINLRRVGADLRINWRDWDLHLGYMEGLDDDALNTNYDITTSYWFAGVDWVIYPWLVASSRYEKINYSDPAGKDLDDQEIGRWTLTATALIRANLKFAAEARLNEGLGHPGTEDDMFLLRLDFSF